MKKIEKASKKKTLMLVLLSILGIIAIFFTVSFIMARLSPIATLIVNKGSAEVLIKDYWTKAKSGMSLKEGNSIKTADDSMATILFLDSSVMRLDENTEIRITNINKSSVSIAQNIGRTWNRLLKISGIKDYEIETPNALATVRGTAFSVTVDN